MPTKGTIRERIRASIAAEVRGYWNELESRWGREIDVDHIEARDGCPDGARAGLRVGTAPVIIVPAEVDVSSASILHELLHFRRYYLQLVPQIALGRAGSLTSAGRDLRDRIAGLENQLEHLVIVPEQRARGHADMGFWVAGQRDLWTGPPPRGREALTWRGKFGLLWTRILDVPDLERSACDWLDAYTLREDAEIFCARALGLLDDKPALAQFVLGARPDIPSDHVALVRFDPAIGAFANLPSTRPERTT